MKIMNQIFILIFITIQYLGILTEGYIENDIQQALLNIEMENKKLIKFSKILFKYRAFKKHAIVSNDNIWFYLYLGLRASYHLNSCVYPT